MEALLPRAQGGAACGPQLPVARRTNCRCVLRRTPDAATSLSQPERVSVGSVAQLAGHSDRTIACRASEVQAPSAAERSERGDEDEDYFRWAAARGIQAPKLQLACFSGLRGVAAGEAVGQGETLVTVPRGMALVVSPKMRCPLPELVDEQYWRSAQWFVKMALLLVAEARAGAASRVDGYIRHLPRSFDMPMQWSDEELAQLQYPALIAEVEKQRANWARFHAELCAALKPGQAVPYDEFLWALQAVRSRCFSAPYSGSPLRERAVVGVPVAAAALAYVVSQGIPLEQSLNGAIAAVLFNILYDLFLSSKLRWYAMFPVVDSMNHSSASTNEVAYEYFRDAFSVTSEASVQQGQQVFISYGAQSNDTLLQYYGFIEQPNPHDTYVFADLGARLAAWGGAAVETRLAALRAADAQLAAALDRAPATPRGFQPQVLQAVRFLLSPPGPQAPLSSFARKGPAPQELAVARALAGAADAEAAAMATSLEEDRQVLQSRRHLMSERQRLAVEFRVAKKTLLRECAAACGKRVRKLQAKVDNGAPAS